jgi:hypothetical protein
MLATFVLQLGYLTRVMSSLGPGWAIFGPVVSEWILRAIAPAVRRRSLGILVTGARVKDINF